MNYRRQLQLGLAALLLTLPGAVALGQAARAIPAGHYELLTARSKFSIVLRKAGLLRAFADNHLIVAKQIEGAATQSGEGWAGEITAPVAALVVADPGRSEKDRHDIWATMESAEQLDAAQYPTIRWRLDSLTRASNDAQLRGSFTIHGVTRTVDWPTHLEISGSRVHVWGEAMLKLTDFNIRPIRRALGAVRVKNEFQLRWDTVWQRQ